MDIQPFNSPRIYRCHRNPPLCEEVEHFHTAGFASHMASEHATKLVFRQVVDTGQKGDLRFQWIYPEVCVLQGLNVSLPFFPSTVKGAPLTRQQMLQAHSFAEVTGAERSV